MSWHATLYSRTEPALTLEEIQSLALSGTEVQPGENGTSVIRWPEAQLTLFPSMPTERLPEHLRGLMGFILQRSGGEVSEWNSQFLQFVQGVKAATACRIDRSGPGLEAESLLLSMAATYGDCLIFAHEKLYTYFGECVFGPEDEPPLVELKRATVRKGRCQPVSQTESQAQRQARVQARLDRYQVPALARPIRWIPDDAEVELRPPSEVALRLLAMHGTVCFARGMERERAVALVGDAALSPQESRLFEEKDEELAQSLIWRLEALVILMWALGMTEVPAWPDAMCDVDGVHDRIFAATQDPAAFVREARLRPAGEILDELELTTRLNWALRESALQGLDIPEHLNWASDAVRLPVRESPLPLVVLQRHHALNWLIGFGGDDWDEVDTPT